jgi:flagellar protein FliS
MTKDKISSFQVRITQSNKTELIVILYEIFFAYMEDAISLLDEMSEEKTSEQLRDYAKAIRMASQVVRHLEDDLNFSYEISGSLFGLYSFVENNIAKASYSLKKEDLEDTLKVMKPLYESFKEVAKADDSKPLMQHTQKVSAGYTYGRNDVNEAIGGESNRGFFA